METDIIKKQLGLRLKELRLARRLNQEDLEKWDFSYRYYGKIERGLINPTLETLVRLCDIFEVTLSDLFVFMTDESDASEEKETVAVKITDILKEGNESKIRKIKIFLDELL